MFSKLAKQCQALIACPAPIFHHIRHQGMRAPMKARDWMSGLAVSIELVILTSRSSIAGDFTALNKNCVAVYGRGSIINNQVVVRPIEIQHHHITRT